MMKLSKWIGVLLIVAMVILPQTTLARDGLAQDEVAQQSPENQYSATTLHWSLGQLLQWMFTRRPPIVLGVLHEFDGEQLTVELERPEHRWRHGRGNHSDMVTVLFHMKIDEQTVLFGPELTRIDVEALTEGDVLTILPTLKWGRPIIQLVYVGTPSDLADYKHSGQLLAEDEETLELTAHHNGSLTVNLDDDTVWLDRGRVERPAELPEEVRLHVLGIKQEDGTVDAALVTTGKFSYP